MSTTLVPGRPARVAIVGGGIAGLAVAHALRQQGAGARGVEVVVLERGQRPGGNIRTDVIDGFTCEWGPNGFLDNAPATLALVDDLGLRPRLQPSDDRARRRFIWRNGRLHPLPGGPIDFLASSLLSWPGKLRIAMEPFASRRPDGDESIHAFASRRIGREAADVLIDSMVSGVFGGDARALSLRACFPKMWQLETDHGGLFRALLARRRQHPRRNGEAIGSPLGRLTSFVGGSEDLVRGLATRLGDVVRTGVDVQAVSRNPQGYTIAIEGDAPLHADAVVLASGSATTARMVRGLDAGLADTLAAIPSATMVVACVGFREDQLPAPLDGFGYLVPRSEGIRTLGVLWDSSVYPGRAPQGHVLMRAMLGGATDPGAIDLDDQALLDVVRGDLRRIMRIEVAPTFVKVFRHALGIPQYTVGHLARLDAAEARLAALPGLLLAGNAYRGVAINACIADAADVASRALAVCSAVPAPLATV
ncbi:protoporphyrinogen oxidase [Luteitalea sp. TBR-22]|uniref:protoporphyrinogen oxidase n=1 Tax=Luteitalea sp. TBR-22 TaxID=2802971 RepID=UPI001AFB946A|nr:protoporphyrinogen oxidase [Luteitalea sp. TBR-22]BCS32165.1 protoporphyrinogen oxidase [Luteitalea sp. TBR-22]